MRTIFTLLLLTVCASISFGQSAPKEFEGKIYYTHTYKIRQPVVDSNELVQSFGASSIYTYKKGRSIWVAKGSQFQYEIYDSFSRLLVDKYAGSDTLYKLDVFNKGDSLLSYEIVENADSICGYRCNAIHVVLQSAADNSIINRTIFYSSKLFVDPQYFTGYKSYASNKVYPLTKAVPLRIVMEFEGLPVEITMNATKVEQASIDGKEFAIDKSLFIKDQSF